MKHYIICVQALAQALFLASVPTARAMPAFPEPFNVEMADGSQVTIQAEGDETGFLLVSAEGYVVIEEEGGQYRYAVPADVGDYSAGVGQGTGTENERVRPDYQREKTPEECFKAICGGIQSPPTVENECQGDDCGAVGRLRRRAIEKQVVGPEVHDRRRRMVSGTGTVKNLVVLVEFVDNQNSLPPTDAYNVLMNSEEKTSITPTGSLKSVYQEISFGQLTIESTVTPWVKVSKSEAFYSGTTTVSTNLHEAIREALDYLEDNKIVDFSDFDSNGDGYIDAITVLHSGYGAEYARADCRGKASINRVWSHKWKLWSDSTGSYVGPWTSKDGVKVWDYHISPALWGLCGNEIGRVGVIAHETGHFLGVQDLYDADGGGQGLGFWCMMSNSWGYDKSQHYPGHMSAYAKMKLGWVEPQTPIEGENTIACIENESSEPLVYKIGDGEFGYPKGEYLLIENRQNFGLDDLLPQTGIAIYHVDEKAKYNEGYPGQYGWPGNGNHYQVAMLQADGEYHMERGSNAGYFGDLFSAETGDVSLVPSKNDPAYGPFPNTDSYQGGVLTKTGVGIYDISESGEVMTFYFTSGYPATKPPTVSPTVPPTSSPTASPTKYPTDSPSQIPSEQPSDIPSDEPSDIPSDEPSESPTYTTEEVRH